MTIIQFGSRIFSGSGFYRELVSHKNLMKKYRILSSSDSYSYFINALSNQTCIIFHRCIYCSGYYEQLIPDSKTK